MNDASLPDSAEAIEEQFLRGLETNPLPLENLLAAIRRLRQAGATTQAETCADLLEEKLAARHDLSAWVQFYEQEPRRADDPAVRQRIRTRLEAACPDRLARILVKHAGFETSIPFAKALARLKVLMRLKPGQFCQDKTWGFGVVREVDDFHERVIIQFAEKPEHAMSLGYAAEALELVAPDHLLARQHQDPTAFRELIRNNPAEVVRLALRSYGPMTVDTLQQRLTRSLIPASDWKRFWDAARPALKRDSRVVFPARRTDLIQLSDSPCVYDPVWFDQFRRSTDPDTVIRFAERFLTSVSGEALPESARTALRDRLLFVIRAGEHAGWGRVLRAVLLSEPFRLLEDSMATGAVRTLLAPEIFRRALADLPVRQVQTALEVLTQREGERALAAFLDVLPDLPLPALNAGIEFWLKVGREDAIRERLRSLVATDTADVLVLSWMARNWDRVMVGWALVPPFRALRAMIFALDHPASGERLKAQHRLREMFEDSTWLIRRLEEITPSERVELFACISRTQHWDVSSRRVALAAMIRQYPDLAPPEEATPDSAAPSGGIRWTSLRSHRVRREEYRRLMEVELPQNRRDLAQARSYGDLRENAEYETARHQQRLLLQRQAQLERELTEVRPTDFSDFPTDRAGVGTAVVVRRADGRTETYAILGEWDRDETRGIVPSGSALARALAGHRPGDTVRLPGPTGDETAVILEVTALPETIRAWVLGQ